MQENTKIIAVLTEEGDLNIHAFDINHIELTMEEGKTDNECEALKNLLSRSYRLCSIQWQEIKRINFKF
jgi:hypothetical protein